MEVSVPKGWSESFVEELSLLSLLGFEPWIVQPLAQSVYQLYPSS